MKIFNKQNWFHKSIRYNLALVTILFFAGLYAVEHIQIPTEVIAYEKPEEVESDLFNALWEQETDRIHREMKKEARIRALTSITNRAGIEGTNIYVGNE